MLWDELLLSLSNSVPFWTAVVLIAALVLFRRPLAELIRRTKRVGTPGMSLEAHEQKPPTPIGEAFLAEATGKADPRKAADELISLIGRNAYLAEREELIKKVLAERGILENSSEAVRVLVAFTASGLITSEFEQLYNIIWGSQIQILIHLNSASLPVSREDLVRFYEAAAALYPDAFRTYPFENYLQFLLKLQLITPIDGKFQITLKGRTFLLYLIHTGKSLRLIC